MRKKLENLAKKIKKMIKKHINSNNVTWTRETLLKLIYIKKINLAKQKSVIKMVIEYNQSLCVIKEVILR